MKLKLLLIFVIIAIGKCIPSPQISFMPDSLSYNHWINTGSLGSSADITSITGEVIAEHYWSRDPNYLCWDSTSSSITYINYDINEQVTPFVTMEVWIYPTKYTSPVWILNHDYNTDGGYDRGIMLYDTRFNGVAIGIGEEYISSIPYVPLNKWTQIVVMFKEDYEARIYINGGQQTGGLQETKGIHHVSTGKTRIGLNGAENHPGHNFEGCISKVQIWSQTLNLADIAALYADAPNRPKVYCSYAPVFEHPTQELFNWVGDIHGSKWTIVTDGTWGTWCNNKPVYKSDDYLTIYLYSREGTDEWVMNEEICSTSYIEGDGYNCFGDTPSTDHCFTNSYPDLAISYELCWYDRALSDVFVVPQLYHIFIIIGVIFGVLLSALIYCAYILCKKIKNN